MPAGGASTVACATLAVNPGAPANITDACGRTLTPVLIGSVSTPDPITCDGTVVWTYRYTACDGTFADWTYTYTIHDNTAPSLTGTLSPINAEGCSTTNLPEALDIAGLISAGAIISDNCTSTNQLTVQHSDGTPSGSCPWTIIRTYTVTDLCGNISAELQQTINIDDNTAPAFTGTLAAVNAEGCNASSAPAALDIAGLIAAGATISDACTPNDQLTVSHSDAAPTGSCPIVIIRTYTVTDLCNNTSASLQQTINIADNTAPTFTGTLSPVNVEGCNAASAPAALDIAGLITAGATISDNCTPNDQLAVHYSDAAPTGLCPLTVIRTYTISDLCNNTSTSLQQNIIITDNTSPVFTGTLSPVTAEGCGISSAPAALNIAGLITAGATISDNCTPNDQLIVHYSDSDPSGTCPLQIIRTYTVADLCGNISAELHQTINVDDNTPPVFTGTLTAIEAEGCNASASPAALDIAGLIAAGAAISDNCTPENQLTVQYTDGTPTGTCPVVIVRTYTVTDLCLNVSTSLTQTINIHDRTAPVITGNLPPIGIESCNTSSLPAALSIAEIMAAGVTITDNCTTVVQLTDQHSDSDPSGTCPSTIIRTYSITDECGNTSTLTQTITVDDQTIPQITCPSDQVRDVHPNAPTYAAHGNEFDYVSATDNCGNVTVTNNLDNTNSLAGHIFDLGVTEVIWTATDACGNTASCSFTVTVYTTSLRLTKRATERNYSRVGDIIHYTLTVDNTGNVYVSDIQITDPGADQGSIVYASGDNDGDHILDHNESWTFTATHTITQADIDAGHYENTATATGIPARGTLEPAVDTEDIPALQTASISLDKRGTYVDADGNGIPNAGDQITYTFTVTNTGNVTITNVTVTDPVIVITGGPVTSLAPGASDGTTFSGTYTLTQADINAGRFTNIATASGVFAGTPYTATDNDVQEFNQNPRIDLIKEGTYFDVNADGIANAGDQIRYDFLVTNLGNVTLTNITITDPFITITGNPIASLIPSASDAVTFTGTYTLTQADIDAGYFTNTATATGTFNGNPVSDTDDDRKEFVLSPAITLIKSGTYVDFDNNGIPSAGDHINYIFTVTNTGNVTISNVTITDPLITVTGGPIASLSPGVSDATTFTGIYTLTQVDINAGTFTNTATATGTFNNNPVTANGSDTQTFTQNPRIELIKTGTFVDFNADGIQSAGDQINYSFTITNTGNVTLTNVSVTDLIIPVTGTALASLAPGASDATTFTGSYTLTQADINNGSFTNTATASGTFNNEQYTSTDTYTETFTQTARIDLIKTGTYSDTNSDGIYSAGDQISYTFTVTNSGNVTLENVSVTDPLITVSGATIPLLLPGASDGTTFTGNYNLRQADIDAGTFTNVAIVTGTFNNTPYTGTDDDKQSFDRTPRILLEKTGSYFDANNDQIPNAGDQIRYTFNITNTGNVTLTNVTVADPLITVSGNPVASLLPGASDGTTFTGTYTLTQADINAGVFTNTATATGIFDNSPVTSSDSDTQEFTRTPSWTLSKVADEENFDAVGDVIHYRISVNNTGNISVSNVTIADIGADAGSIAYASGDSNSNLLLDPAETWIFNATHTVSQSDLDAGHYINTATVNGTPSAGTLDPAEASEDVPGIQTASWILTKTAAGTGYELAGDIIHYNITVENTGNVSISNVIVTDPGADANSITYVSGDSNSNGLLDPSERWIYTAAHTVNHNDVDARHYLNTATAEGRPAGGTLAPATDSEDVPMTVVADWTLTKIPSETGYGEINEVLHYTINVENTGNVPISSVSVIDPGADAGSIGFVSGDSNGNNILDLNETWTYSAVHTISQTDLNNGHYANTATVSGIPAEGTLVPASGSADVPGIRTPGWAMTKDATETEYHAVGDVIHYALTLDNSGNVSINNVTLTDPGADAGSLIMISGDTNENNILDPDETWSYSAQHTVTQADLENGHYRNTATANGTPAGGSLDPVTATEDVPAVTAPVLVVSKTPAEHDYDAVGDVIHYSITVQNTGNVSLDNILVTDPLTDLHFTIPTLGPNAVSAPIATEYIIPQTYLDAGHVANTATASYTYGLNSYSATGSADVPAIQHPAVSITKDAAETEFDAEGDILNYTIVVTNTGNVTLTNVLVSDPLTGLNQTIPILLPGDADAVTFTTSYTTIQDDFNNGVVENTVTASTLFNGVTVEAEAQETVIAALAPRFNVTKIVDHDNISAPVTLNYTITIINTGNISLTGITVTDVFAGGAVYSSGDDNNNNVLDQNETWTYTVDYDATQYDIDTGNDLVNTVSVTSAEVTNPVTAQAVTTIARAASLAVSKVVDNTSISVPAVLNYTITIRNTGTVSLTGITVTDEFAGGAAYSSGDANGNNILDVSETWIYTADYNATQADIDVGTDLINTVSVTSAEVLNPVTARAVTTISRNASLAVEKTVDQVTISAPTTLNYTIRVRNTGAVSLTNVRISDPITGGATYQSGDVNGNNVVDLSETWTYTAQLIVTQAMINAGTDIVNVARATSSEVPNPVSANAVTTINQTASWTLTNTAAEPNYDAAGDVLHYRIVVDNTGNVPVSNVNVTVTGADPGSTIYVSGDTNGNRILDPDETWIYSSAHTVTQADINAGHYANIATATGTRPGGTMPPVSDPEDVPANQRPEITITKSAVETSYVAIGDLIHYNLIVRNSGNVTLTGVTVTDPDAVVTCTGSPYTLAAGESRTCTAVHTVTAGDITSGSVTNVATSSGRDPGNDLISDNSNQVVVRLNNQPPVIICPSNISVNASPTAPNAVITGGLAANYSDPNNNVATLTWTMTGATTASSDATGINNLTTAVFNLGVTTVTYTVTDALGLSATCSFTVTVIDNTPPVAVCRDITVYLDLTLGTVSIIPADVDGGSYDNSGHIATMTINLSSFDCTDLGPNMVTLTVTDESGNSDQCVSVVTVEYPVVPAPAVSPASDIICNEGSTAFVLTNNIPATSWTWTVTSGSSSVSGASGDNSGLLSSINQVLANSDSVVHNVVYTITPRVYGSCNLPPVTGEVWVNPRPMIRVHAADKIICDGGSTTIFVRNPNTSVRGDWMYDMTVIPEPGITGYTTGRTYSDPTNLNETLYNSGTEIGRITYRFTPRIVPEDGGINCTDGTEKEITIMVRPSLRHRYTVDSSYYNGFNISCYGKLNGYIHIVPRDNAVPMTYYWTGPDGFTSTSKDISGLRAGRYIVHLTDIYNCTAADTFDLRQPGRLRMNISAPLGSDGYNIRCAGGQDGDVTISAVNNVGLVDYMWSDGYLGNNRNNLAAGTYKMIISDSNSCLSDSTVTLTEPEKIRITFDIKQPFCPEKPDGAVRPEVTGGVPAADYLYQWSDNSRNRNLIDVPAGLYILTVTDNNGCTETKPARVTSENEICLVIPEAFSPDRNNINDLWNIGGIEYYPNCEITIYNRWGQMVWKSEKGYPIPWDGRSEGKRLPIDSYHFVIELHNGLRPLMGSVTIVR